MGGRFLQTEEVPTDVRRSEKEDEREIQTRSHGSHKDRRTLRPLLDQKARGSGMYLGSQGNAESRAGLPVWLPI